MTLFEYQTCPDSFSNNGEYFSPAKSCSALQSWEKRFRACSNRILNIFVQSSSHLSHLSPENVCVFAGAGQQLLLLNLANRQCTSVACESMGSSVFHSHLTEMWTEEIFLCILCRSMCRPSKIEFHSVGVREKLSRFIFRKM